MEEKAIIGTIDLTIPPPSCNFDNTRPGWPSSSLVPMFNRTGGPSAAAVLDGSSDQPVQSAVPPARQAEVVEVIDQEILPLGDAPLRDIRVRPHAAVQDVGQPGSAQEAANGLRNQNEFPAVAIEVLVIPNRGGRRPKPELYPFGSIKVARNVDGGLEGESFLIPDREEPKRIIAVARKRYGRGRRFETRQVPGGVRVWRKS